MPQRIIDDLESVEIDKQYREAPLVAARRLDRVMKQPVERFSIGQTGQAVVRCEVFDPSVRLGFLVGAVEILKGKRHVVGQSLQEFDEFGCKGVLLGGKKKHNANRLPADEQRKCRARLGPIAANNGVEGT